MAWGSKDQIMTAQSVVGTELFATARSLNPGASDRIHIKGNSNGTTDSLVVSVYTTLDASSEEWTTVPDFSFIVDCTDGADNIVQITMSGPYRYRVGCVRDGSIDTITTDIWARNDGIDV